MDCSIYLAEALIGIKNYARARAMLNQSEKPGLRALLEQSRYQRGRALQLSGNPKEAASHLEGARRDLDEIKKDAGTESAAKRSDLALIYAVAADSVKYSRPVHQAQNPMRTSRWCGTTGDPLVANLSGNSVI